MTDILNEVPLPLLLLLGFLGVIITLLSCAPSAWIGKAEQELRKRREHEDPQP